MSLIYQELSKVMISEIIETIIDCTVLPYLELNNVVADDFFLNEGLIKQLFGT